MLDLTEQTFDAEVLHSPVPVLVDFWAAWCGPCKAIAPILEKLASDYGDRLKVAKVNIDTCPQLPVDYRIQSIPTLCLFKDGVVVAEVTGAKPRAALDAFLAPHLSP